jgi:hypothetical protein
MTPFPHPSPRAAEAPASLPSVPALKTPLLWFSLFVAILWLPLQFVLAGVPATAPFYEAAFVGELGVVEMATALLLLPAAWFALVAARRLFRSRNAPAGALLCLVALGCVVLSGEELSWGQHLIGWGSPDYFAERNVQGETNLHNMAGVNKSLPKWFVVIGIAFGGIVVPLLARAGRLPAMLKSRWAAPLLPGIACLPVAAVTLAAHLAAKVVAKAMGFRFEDRFGVDVPENVEMFISVFMLIYALGLVTGGRDRAAGAG